MHPVHVEMVEFLVVLVIGDDCKSPWTDPDPKIVLIIITCIERPYGPPTHFYEAEIRVDFITEIRVDVTKVVGQLR